MGRGKLPGGPQQSGARTKSVSLGFRPPDAVRTAPSRTGGHIIVKRRGRHKWEEGCDADEPRTVDPGAVDPAAGAAARRSRTQKRGKLDMSRSEVEPGVRPEQAGLLQATTRISRAGLPKAAAAAALVVAVGQSTGPLPTALADQAKAYTAWTLRP